MSTKPELLIDVYTDPICPWCRIGGAQLERTLQSEDFAEQILPYMQPVVKLRPYILDPRLPATSFEPPSAKYVDIATTDYTKGSPPTKRSYYSKKFTSLDAFDAKISKAAKEVDLPAFDWLSEGKVGATWLAHRLLWYALQQQERAQATEQDTSSSRTTYRPGLQEQLASRLYNAFHTESLDLSDSDVLAQLAVEVPGLFADKAAALRWLQTDEGDYEVNQAADVGIMNGVMSVPFLIVQDGSDHSSEVLNHQDLMRMFTMQASAFK